MLKQFSEYREIALARLEKDCKPFLDSFERDVGEAAQIGTTKIRWDTPYDMRCHHNHALLVEHFHHQLLLKKDKENLQFHFNDNVKKILYSVAVDLHPTTQISDITNFYIEKILGEESKKSDSGDASNASYGDEG